MPVPLTMTCLSDLAGQVRGKGFVLSDLERRVASGVGWTPTNAQITCFDGIAPSPFGSTGDVILWPDPEAQFAAALPAGPPLRMVLGDVRERNGSPWIGCLRGHLRAAIDRLEGAAGLKTQVSFEHEFTLSGGIGPGFSLAGFHAAQGFAEDLMHALNTAGLSPDSFLREYGPAQFEITLPPRPPLRAADEAIVLREVTRAVARAHDRQAIFAPVSDPDTVGNGVHIHLSFWTDDGAPATHDPDAPAGLSAIAGQAAAGIVAHMPAIVALTSPSVPSYHRLQPHKWSASFANLAVQDREAGLRICPVSATAPDRVARQYHYEYRAADACASPWLALSALLHAAADGVERSLPCPAPTRGDLSDLSVAELVALKVAPLPRHLEAALCLFEESSAVADWYGADFVSLYAAHKRHEAGEVSALELRDMLAKYAKVY